MIELKLKLRENEQKAFQRVLLLNPAHVVSVWAPYASRNLGCEILTVAGVVYAVDTMFDDVLKLLAAAPVSPQTEPPDR